MEKNAYFEQMRETAIAYNKAREEWGKKRNALVEADDWDAVKALDEREKTELPNPFKQGETKALIAYDRNLRNGADYFEIENLPWDYELEDFVKTMRMAGIRDAVVTDQSTGLMDGIYGLTALGCAMGGLKKVTRADDHRFGSKEPEIKNGIEFYI